MDQAELDNWNKRVLEMGAQELLLLEYITKLDPKWRKIFVRKEHFFKEAIRCTVCETAGISGLKSLQQHITGKKHQFRFKSNITGIRVAEDDPNSGISKGDNSNTTSDGSQMQSKTEEKAIPLPKSDSSSKIDKGNNKFSNKAQNENTFDSADFEAFRNRLITLKLEDLLKVEYKYVNTDWKRLIEKKGNFLYCLMCKNMKLGNVAALRNHFKNRQHATNILLVKMLHHPVLLPNKNISNKFVQGENVDLTSEKQKTQPKITMNTTTKNISTIKGANSVRNSNVQKDNTTKTGKNQYTGNEGNNKNSESASNKIPSNEKSQSTENRNQNKENVKVTSVEKNTCNIGKESSSISNNKTTSSDVIAVGPKEVTPKILDDEEFRRNISRLSVIEINKVEYLMKGLWFTLVFCGENNYSCYLCELLNANGSLLALRQHFAGRLHKERLQVVQKFFHPKYTKSKKELEQQNNTAVVKGNSQQKEVVLINLDEYSSPEKELFSPNTNFVLNPATVALKNRQEQNSPTNAVNAKQNERNLSVASSSQQKNIFDNTGNGKNNVPQKSFPAVNNQQHFKQNRGAANSEIEKKQEKIITPRINAKQNERNLSIASSSQQKNIFDNTGNEKNNVPQKTFPAVNNQQHFKQNRGAANSEIEKKQEKIIIPRINFSRNSAKNTNFYEKDVQKIDETNEGLIGVEYVVKILKNVNDTSPRFECCLCEGEMNASGMQLHLKSLSHRRKYLERHFPTCMRQFQQYSKHKNFNYLLTNVAKKLAIAIEKYHGRDLPFECLEDEYRLNRDGIVSKVFSFRHSSETCGPSFTNIIDQKTIEDLINDTSKRKFSSENDYSNNYTQRKRARDSGPGLDVEEHKKLVEAFLENTRRGYRQRSVSPLRHHDNSRRSASKSFRNDCKSRSRSRSPVAVIIDTKQNWQNYRRMLTHAMEDLDKDYEEYKKNPESHPDYSSEWKAYWLDRSKELRDEGREPSTHNFQPGWIRFFSKRIYELYDEAVNKLKKTLRKKLSLPMDVNSPRSEDITMSPKKNIFDNAFKTIANPTATQFPSHIPQQNTMSMQFLHNNNNNNNMMMMMNKPISYPMVNNSIQNQNAMTMMQSESNSRPSFVEQQNFARSESFNSGRYSPHWENTHQEEPTAQERRARNEKHQEEERHLALLNYKAREDKEKTLSRRDTSPFFDRCSGRDTSENRFNSKSLRRNSSDFDDSPKDSTYSIPVLRLLTALEDHLGILGPRVVNLLSEALTLEKVKPNSVDEELLNRENYVFLETVREKLRGQILADVVGGPQERAIKKALKYLQTLLKKVGDKHLRTPITIQSERADTAVAPSSARKESSTISSTSPNSNIVVNKEEVAAKLAAALAAQGKTDITPDELKQLIAVYTLIEQKQQEVNNSSQPSGSRTSNTVQQSKCTTNIASAQKKSLSDTLLDILKTSSKDDSKTNSNENPQNRCGFSERIDQPHQTQQRMQSAERDNRQQQQQFRQNIQESFRTDVGVNRRANISSTSTAANQQQKFSSTPNVGNNSSSNLGNTTNYRQNNIPNFYNFSQGNQQQQQQQQQQQRQPQQQLVSGNQSYGQYNIQQVNNPPINPQFGGLSQFDTSLRLDHGGNAAVSSKMSFTRRTADQGNNFTRYSLNQSGQTGTSFRNLNPNPGLSNNSNNNNNNPRPSLPVNIWQNQINPWARNW